MDCMQCVVCATVIKSLLAVKRLIHNDSLIGDRATKERSFWNGTRAVRVHVFHGVEAASNHSPAFPLDPFLHRPPRGKIPMLRHLGYVGQNLSLGMTTSRGTILRNATPERLRALTLENLHALAEILAFNARERIYIFRISSRIIPFASHPVNRLEWWREFATELAELGRYVRNRGMRVSMHPGQYTLLNAPDPRVLEASLRDLEWHTRFLDSLGLGPEHKIVLHAGGAYADKTAAMDRLVEVHRRLPETVSRRLVLENDDRIYAVGEVLALSARTGMPVVFDWLHHRANPGGVAGLHDLLERCFTTWREPDGPPKVHFSSQAPGTRPGAHSAYVDKEEFLRFYREVVDLEFDCMLEAKAKDLALLRLRQELSWLPLAA